MKRNRCVYRLFLTLLMIFTGSMVFGQVEETGSLRSFILGNEPAAAYDNWLSHVVEGVAEEGGVNDYIPEELDPQTNGFGEFQYISEEDADSALSQWHTIFRGIWNDRPDIVQNVIEATGINYELVYFDDTETGRTYRMLRETLDPTFVDTGYYAGPDDDVTGSFRHGWGLMIFSPESAHPGVNLQAPHPNDDFISVPIAVDLFLRGDISSLFINGSGREVLWPVRDNYNNGNSLSDPSRNPNLPFNWFTGFFLDTVRVTEPFYLVIQAHSYDTGRHHNRAPLQISCGGVDGFPNRPSRDISNSGHDWVNYIPTVAVPQDYCFEDQPAVEIEDYVAVWRATGLIHISSGREIPTNVDLPGYNSPQMNAASVGRHRFESFDPFLHYEMDELPEEMEDADISELDLYEGTIPPTEENWTTILRYYESAVNGLISFIDDVYTYRDPDPPWGLQHFQIHYAGDDFMELSWGRAYDPNFARYEIFYDSLRTIDENSPLWTFTRDGDLVGQQVQETTIPGLRHGIDYGFRIRALDYFDNATPLSPVVRAVVVEGNEPPLPFSLLSPMAGDTVVSLDTILTWEATTDPDPYDTPHYDLWLATEADFSDAVLIEDSTAYSSTFLENLQNYMVYYWTVRATDRNSPGTWATDTLYFQTFQHSPPTDFALLAPLDRSTIWNGQDTVATWQSSSDPDQLGEIHYILQWAFHEDFDPMLGNETLTDTSFAFTGLLLDSTYWWRVYAEDGEDTTLCLNPSRFYPFSYEAPEFQLLSPEDGHLFDRDTVTVSWSLPGTPHHPVIPPELAAHQIQRTVNELDSVGGPDQYGYMWIDNNQGGGPPYQWVDISETGTPSTTGQQDDGTQTVDLPFLFPFYGEFYSTVTIASNGNLHFGPPNGDSSNSPILDEDGPQAMIAPWWTDLRPNSRGDIYYDGNLERFIVEYEQCREYRHSSYVYTFEVILYPNGNIKFQYDYIRGSTQNATVGIENSDATDGLQITYNEDYIEEGMAILITRDQYVYHVQWSLDPDFSTYSQLATILDSLELTDMQIEELVLGGSGNAELDELPDDATIYWRVATHNLFSQRTWANPGAEGWHFSISVPNSPAPFSLRHPYNGGFADNDTVLVEWETAVDRDPGDLVRYVIEWSPDSLYEVVQRDTTFQTDYRITTLLPPEMDEIPDQSMVYWRVHAIDNDANLVWANGDTLGWSFQVQLSGFQSIPLSPVYFELVSTNLMPFDLEAETLFTPVNDLAIVYQSDGGIWIPDWINTIGTLDPTQGYYFFCEHPSYWDVRGTELPPDTEYEITSGPWNWIGYPFEISVPSETALSEILDQLVIIMNSDGGFWIPGVINAMPFMEPGMGYMVITDEDVTFTYSQGPAVLNEQMDPVIDLANVSDFDDRTGKPYLVLLQIPLSLYDSGAASAEVYDGSLLVGKSLIDRSRTLVPIIAWEGDEAHRLEGFTPGNPITIHLLDENGDVLETDDQGIFGALPYYQAQLRNNDLPEISVLYQNTPNPFNPVTTIRFSLPQTTDVRIRIYNFMGQEIMVLLNGPMSAGYHTVLLNLSEYASGIYVCSLETPDRTAYRKMLLLK